MIYNEEKAEKWIKNYLDKNNFPYSSIKRIRKLPQSLIHIDWSFGAGAEVDYYYEIRFIDRENTPRAFYVIVSTFLNFFVLKNRCFIEQFGKMKISGLATIKDQYL